MTISKSSAHRQSQLFPLVRDLKNVESYSSGNDVSFNHGDCVEFLKTIPGGSAKLVITSPPYNIGKSYEKRLELDD